MESRLLVARVKDRAAVGWGVGEREVHGVVKGEHGGSLYGGTCSVSRLPRCQCPGCGTALQFCKLLPLRGERARDARDPPVFFLSTTCESTIISR